MKSLKYLLLVSLFISFFNGYGQSILPGDHYVILPFDKDAFTSLPKNSTSDSLVDADFATIEQVLSECIDKYNREQTAEYNKFIKKYSDKGFQVSHFLIDLKEYYRQYMVNRNEKGEKEVWVNCFCSIHDMDYWRKNIVRVMDGGKCYFNLRINLTKKTFADFMVNGSG